MLVLPEDGYKKVKTYWSSHIYVDKQYLSWNLFVMTIIYMSIVRNMYNIRIKF